MAELPPGFRVVQQGRQGPRLPPGFRVVPPEQQGAPPDALPAAGGSSISFAPNLTSLPIVGPIAGAMGMDGRPNIEGLQTGARERYDAALAPVREQQFPTMNDEQWAEYSAKAFAPYGPTELAQHGALFGLTDELGAGMGALGAGARQLFTGQGPGIGESYQQYETLEQARRDLGREKHGNLGMLAEGVGGLASGGTVARGAQAIGQGGNAFLQTLKGVSGAGAQGAAYGFGATDGDLGGRGWGAAQGAGVSMAAGAALPAVARMGQGMAHRGAQRAATGEAVAAAPRASAIKAQSKAGYRSSEATGAVIGKPAMSILNNEVRAFAQAEGLLLPSGRLADGFPKFAGALRTVKEFSDGPINIKQAQTVQRALRRVAKSSDPEEARLGAMMLDNFEDFMDKLPPAAFDKGNGAEAVKLWTQARKDWARFRRTQTIEGIIENARLADGGFAAGIRSGFKRVLRSPKKQRGFSPEDISAMREFVDGGNMDTLLKRMGSGAGLPGVGVGGLAGGWTGAVAVPVVGALARGAINRGARHASEQLRASVATPGGARQLPPMLPNRTVDGVARRIGVNSLNPAADNLFNRGR